MPEDWVPSVISMACFLTPLGGRMDTPDHAHVHEYDELCLITGTATTIIHAGIDTRADPGTLYLFRHGERHGFKNSGRQEPHLWVIHYRSDPRLERDHPELLESDPAKRMWRLDEERRGVFTGMFLRLLAEQGTGRALASAASSAWLRLLLVTAARWQEDPAAPTPAVPVEDAELLKLWQLINDHVGNPADLPGAIRREIPNYDSLRHRFRKVFKAAPRELLISLRMQTAKNMLLESSLSVSQVAERLGYARSHEFARAFHREVGCTPTWWREHAGNNPSSPEHLPTGRVVNWEGQKPSRRRR